MKGEGAHEESRTHLASLRKRVPQLAPQDCSVHRETLDLFPRLFAHASQESVNSRLPECLLTVGSLLTKLRLPGWVMKTFASYAGSK